MYIKILACLLVVGGFTSIGFYYSLRPKYRKNDLLSLKRALHLLVSEMKFLSSIKEAIKNIEDNIEEPIKAIFKTFYENMENRLGEDVQILWEDALRENIKKTYLQKEDEEEMKIIGKSLSSIDKDFNIEAINMITEYIDTKMEDIEKEKNKNTKMYQSLGVLSGLMIVILLI